MSSKVFEIRAPARAPLLKIIYRISPNQPWWIPIPSRPHTRERSDNSMSYECGEGCSRIANAQSAGRLPGTAKRYHGVATKGGAFHRTIRPSSFPRGLLLAISRVLAFPCRSGRSSAAISSGYLAISNITDNPVSRLMVSVNFLGVNLQALK